MNLTESVDSICPSCGRYKTLIESIGFCIDCTKHRFPGHAICENCGKVEPRGQYRSLCNYCRKNKWFEENADAIELYMGAGLTYGMAVVRVLFDNRPSCISCGDKIRGATKEKEDKRTVLFCSAREECKREARYFKYLRLDKGKTREEALEIISERIIARSEQVA